MTKVLIGDFAIWEKDKDGNCTYQYLEGKSVPPLSNTNIPIINVIIDNRLRYDNSITSTEIARELEKNGIKGYDNELIKKAIQRIRKKLPWSDAITSSGAGYTIDISRVDENDTVSNTADEPSSASDGDTNSVETQTDSVQVLSESQSLDRTAEYISNFNKDKGKTHTYYFSTTPHSISDVYCPTSLINKENDSYVQIKIKHEEGEHNRYIISGPIGSGKSILARALANEVSNKYSKYQIIPVIYDLSTLSDTKDSLFDLLKKEYEAYIPNDESNIIQSAMSLFAPSDFLTYCRQGKFLFIFDSLDKLHPDVNSQFMQKLKMFLRTYGDNTIVILTRPTSNFVEYESFTVLNMAELTEKQASSFIDKLISPNDTDNKQKFKDRVMSKYDNLFGPSFFYRNPLYLSIIAKKSRKYRFCSLPSLHETIESYIKYATCEDRINTQQRYSKTQISHIQLNNDLSVFCYYLLFNGINSFDIGVFDNCRRGLSMTVHYSSEDFLDDLCRVYGLTQFVDGKYEFIDKSLVEYFYVKYILEYDRELSSVIYTLNNNTIYSSDTVLDLLCEMHRNSLEINLYCPMIDEFCGAMGSEKDYENFLVNYFHKLEYYVGTGDHTVNNYRTDDLYRHMVRDFRIQQDINHLVLPPSELYKSRAVYKINKTEAKRIQEEAGLVEENRLNKQALQQLNKKPVGYVYSINVHNVLHGKDKDSLAIRAALMDEDFPLRIEFEQALIIAGNIECGC